MTITEFFYWLQGFFELSAEGIDDAPLLPSITPKRAACVHRHAALVRAANPDGAMGQRFVRIEMLAELLQDAQIQTVTRDEYVRKMRTEISEQFEHVIDPQAGDADQQAKLNAIHHGRPTRPGGPVYRC